MITSLPGVDLNAWTSLVPILNIALLIKAIFLGEAGRDAALFTLGSSALYATLNPGAYTAIVEGVGGATGVGLVEVYDTSPVPDP